MTAPHLRIATRNSPLALWQASHVRDALCHCHPGLRVELIGMTTQGDRLLDQSLSAAGGKGLFIKELEQALQERRADIAVHSMKDVTVQLPDGLALPVILKRDDPRDVFISNRFDRLEDLPEAASIGTSSLRRQCQLRAWRPGLIVHNLRGNVGTRLKRLDAGEFDAVILAAAGVRRLNLEDRIKECLGTDRMLPAPGQGAMGIEVRVEDQEILDLVQPLDDELTHVEVTAERAVSRRLYGGCHLPLAAYAEVAGCRITVRGLVGHVDGSGIITAEVSGALYESETVGLALAEKLLAQGADDILRKLIPQKEVDDM